MNTLTRRWLWLSAAVSALVGLLLVWNDSSAGWFLIVLGAIDLGLSTRGGKELDATGSTAMRLGLTSVALLVTLALAIGLVLAAR